MDALEFLKHRWYLVVGALVGVWIVIKLMGSGSSGSTTSSATIPAGVGITYTGTNANDAAVQVAQLQNQSSLAGMQIAAAQAGQLATLAEHATESTNAANVSIAGITTSGKVSIAGIDAGAAMRASDNATALGIVQSNNGKAVSIKQANDAYLLGLDTNATNLKALVNSNATQLAGYGLQSQVANNQIAALENIAIATSGDAAKVQTSAITAQQQLLAQQLSNQATVAADTYRLVSSGQLNKGGSGGTNQVAAWNAAVNPSSAASGNAASATVAYGQATSSQIAGIITAIGGAVKNGLSAVIA